MGRVVGVFLMLAALIAALLLLPEEAGKIAAGLLIVGFGLSTFSILRRQSHHYGEGRIDRTGFVRNCVVGILGMLITLGLSILLARWVITIVIAQLQGLAGLILGLLAALLIGAVMSMLVQSTWGRLAIRPASG